jgi:hypothetical protein
MSWTSFLEAAPAADHAVQIYDDVTELCASVGSFVAAGVAVGEPALVIATAGHRDALAAHFEARGLRIDGLQAAGLLTFLDADSTLATFMDGDLPSSDRFEEAVGGVVDAISARHPDMTIRAFGEMVDVLWHRGAHRAAVALEELWNELAQTRRFALLCGYHLDIFDADVQTGALPEIFRVHTHVRPAADPSRLAAAVDRALAEVVGAAEAGQIYLQVAEQVPRTQLPRAQAVLAWLSSRRTPAARRVLARVRDYYTV